MSFKVDGEPAFDLPLSEVLQCHAASKKSHEAVIKFHQVGLIRANANLKDDTASQANTESLVEMRFYFPPQGDEKDGSEDEDEKKKKKDVTNVT